MLPHGPSVLTGPITQTRPWWFRGDAALDISTMKETEACASTDEPIRMDLVERVRRAIADGTYETPEKWDIALDRLLDRIEPTD